MNLDKFRLQREATETDLEENHFLEMIGDIIWTTTLEITHCPYCGERLYSPDSEVPADLGRYEHIDCVGWSSRKM